VSQKKVAPKVSWIFLQKGWEFLVQFYTPIILLYVSIYAGLQIFIQLSAALTSYATLSELLAKWGVEVPSWHMLRDVLNASFFLCK